MFTAQRISIAVSFWLALAMSAHAESCRGGGQDKPIAELQYMSAYELKSEFCLAGNQLVHHLKGADLYIDAGGLEGAQSALNSVTACQEYKNKIARVLTKDHKSKAPTDCVKE